jgi:nucleoid-associated protein YgaU
VITNESFGKYFGTKTVDPNTGKLRLKAFKVENGKKFAFRSLTDYKNDNKTEPPLIWVEQSFADNLVSGNEIGGGSGEVNPDPKPNPKTYTIVAGDSLSSIAIRFGTTVVKLMQLNNIVNADRISIGQVLKLP